MVTWVRHYFPSAGACNFDSKAHMSSEHLKKRSARPMRAAMDIPSRPVVSDHVRHMLDRAMHGIACAISAAMRAAAVAVAAAVAAAACVAAVCVCASRDA